MLYAAPSPSGTVNRAIGELAARPGRRSNDTLSCDKVGQGRSSPFCQIVYSVCRHLQASAATRRGFDGVRSWSCGATSGRSTKPTFPAMSGDAEARATAASMVTRGKTKPTIVMSGSNHGTCCLTSVGVLPFTGSANCASGEDEPAAVRHLHPQLSSRRKKERAVRTLASHPLRKEGCPSTRDRHRVPC